MDKEYIILLASVISALATVVLAVLTSRYVKLTYEMVNEIKKSRNPIVIINFIKRIGHHMTKIDLIISNKGLSPAKDIRLKAEHGIKFLKTELVKGESETTILQLNELPIFKDSLPYLAPGKDISHNVGSIDNEDIQKNPYVWINYSYKTEAGETIYSNIKLDLRYFPNEE